MTKTAPMIASDYRDRFRPTALAAGALLATLLLFSQGCATLKVTNPAESATQQFLESEAAHLAVSKITADQLRDRKVFVDDSFLFTVTDGTPPLSYKQIPQRFLFLLAELRSKLLLSGARLVDKKEDSEIVVEVRSGGVSVDFEEFLIGIPSISPFDNPELAVFRSTKQLGYAGVAFVAYWRDTGEIAASSGPFVGRTGRSDYWILGLGPTTVGNIPPAQKPPPETNIK